MNLTKIVIGIVLILATLLTLRLAGVFFPTTTPSAAPVIPQATAPSVVPVTPSPVTPPAPTAKKALIKLGAALPDRIYSGNPYYVKITVKNINDNPVKNIRVYEKASGSGNFAMTHCDVPVTSVPSNFARINIGDLAPGEQFETTCYGNSQSSKTDTPGKQVNWELYYDYDNGERLPAGSILLTLDSTMTFWTVENKVE